MIKIIVCAVGVGVTGDQTVVQGPSGTLSVHTFTYEPPVG